MERVYSNQLLFNAQNIANILLQYGINCQIKNQFIASAAGDLAPHDTWSEVWVNKKDVNRALEIVEDTTKDSQSYAWYCAQCGEHNGASFELCWACQTVKSEKLD